MVPKPVPSKMICSLCGLDWSRHPEKAGYEDCIKLLKADLAKKQSYLLSTTGTSTLPSNWQPGL